MGGTNEVRLTVTGKMSEPGIVPPAMLSRSVRAKCVGR